LTDDDGRYEFTELPAGTFSVGATSTGYVTLQYGQRRPFEPGTPVAVADGQRVERIDVSLPRGAVIAVRLTDDLGRPISGVEVRAHRFQYRSDGQRTLAGIYTGVNTTDDRGEIRLFGLMPGEYVVGALYRLVSARSTPGNATSDAYAPTFYPGVISASQAAPITVRLGEEKAVQFSLVRSRLARISGVVVDSRGRPANGARVSLATATPGVFAGANVGPDGTFAIGDVPPGEYSVLVTFDAIEEVAATLTNVGDDISDVRIAVGPGASVSGRVVFEGGPPPAAAPPVRVVLASAASSPSPAVMPARATTILDADGRFGFSGVTGRVIVETTLPEGWMMQSVVVEGDEVIDTPIDLGGRATLSNMVITVTNRLTTVRGQVSDARGLPVRDYVVVMVPAETFDTGIMARRVRAVRPGLDATFTARGMRPGRYLVTAVEALEEGLQFSPEFQQHVRRLGQELSLREGETATLSLRLTPDL
jgi:hypothetical protein